MNETPDIGDLFAALDKEIKDMEVIIDYHKKRLIEFSAKLRGLEKAREIFGGHYLTLNERRSK